MHSVELPDTCITHRQSFFPAQLHDSVGFRGLGPHDARSVGSALGASVPLVRSVVARGIAAVLLLEVAPDNVVQGSLHAVYLNLRLEHAKSGQLFYHLHGCHVLSYALGGANAKVLQRGNRDVEHYDLFSQH